MDVLTLDELKIINEKINKEIEKLENPTTTSSNQNIGRPKKNLVLKKTELRIKPDVYYNLSILAEIDGRSTNNYICQILESITQEEGNKDKIINYLRERGEK